MTMPNVGLDPRMADLLAMIHGPAIRSMTPSGQPDVTPPPAQMAPPNIPMPPPPQMPEAPPSLWQRVQQNLMPVPQAMQGLLGQGDVTDARRQGLLSFGANLLANSGGVVGGAAPSLGQMIGSGIQAGQRGFNQSLSGALEAQDVARKAIDWQQQQAVAQQAAAEKQRILAFRSQIERDLPYDPKATPEQIYQVALKRWSAAQAAGDEETLAKSSEVIKTLISQFEKQDKLPPKPDITNLSGAGGSIKSQYNPVTKQWEETRIPFIAPPHYASGGGSGGRPQVRSAINPATGRNELAAITRDENGQVQLDFLGVDAPSTESQRSAAADLPGIESAVTEITRLTDPTLGEQKDVSMLDAALSKGGMLGNPLKSDTYRQYEQALNEFISLYPFSKGGKQLTDSEMLAIINALKIVPGDDTKTKARKRAAFSTKVREIRQRAGGAMIQTGAPASGDAADAAAAAWLAKRKKP